MSAIRWLATAGTIACAGLVAQACSGGGGAGALGPSGVTDDASSSPGADGSSSGAADLDAAAGSPTSSGTPDAGGRRDATAAHDAGSPGAGKPDSGGAASDGGALDQVRQECVDRINMYRATLKLTPLARATPSQEACSDKGAMQDATNNSPHSSAGMCPSFGGQDTCPDLPIGGFSGATLASSLMQCLDQMWAEGPPPSGTTVNQCIQDYQNCFLKHGHYINMSMPNYTVVSCGFFKMTTGDYWGNQDFAY